MKEDKKLFLVKTRYGADLLGAELLFEDGTWTVCGLAKQEYRNNIIWQWWVIVKDERRIK